MSASSFDLSNLEKTALEAIRRSGEISRVEIAQALGVTRAHASNTAKALLQRGLIEERAVKRGARGQPERMIRLAPHGAFAVGVNFSHASMEVGLIDFQGELVSLDRRGLGEASIPEIAEAVALHIKHAGRRLDLDLRRLCGIGVTLPGDFKSDHRRINAHAYFPQFRDLDIREVLQTYFAQRVFVENDSTSAAWGEYVAGAGRQLTSFLFVHIGHGVGGGLVIDGRVFRGHHGNAGVFGMPFPLNQPRPSGQDLLETLRAAGLELDDFAALDALSPESTLPLDQWLDRAAGQLRDALGVLARAFDPEAIIIGGRLPERINAELTRRIDNEAFCALNRSELPVPAIIPSRLAETAGLVGAASLAFAETVFHDPWRLNQMRPTSLSDSDGSGHAGDG